MLTSRDVIGIVAGVFDTSVEQLLEQDRRLAVAKPRFAVYYVLRARGRTFGEIGHACRRDTTTVRHGVGRAMDLIPRDADFRGLLSSALSQVEFAAQLRESVNPQEEEGQ